MIKLIASDIDGTLVKSGSRNIAPAYFSEIKRLADSGITFVVASGRQEDSVRQAFAPVLDRVYLITNNGANLSYRGEMLINKIIDKSVLRPLCEDLRALGGCDTMLATSDTLFYFPETTREALDYTGGSYGFSLAPFESYESLPDINKVCVFRSGDYPHPALTLGGKYESVDMVVPGSEWVDFSPIGVSKGNALAVLQAKLGISAQETISFGDQENDVSMFKISKVAYAVKTASSVALEAADIIIPSYENMGVLEVLKNIE